MNQNLKTVNHSKREVLSDEEEIYSGVERRDSSASDDPHFAQSKDQQPDAVSLSRISIRSFDSHQSFETQSVVTAAEIR